MGGSTKTRVIDTTPGDIKGLRSQINSYLTGPPALPQGGASGTNNPIINRILNPSGIGGPIFRADPYARGGGDGSITPPQPGGYPTTAGTGIDRIRMDTPRPYDRTVFDRTGAIEDPSRSGIRDVQSGASMVGDINLDQIRHYLMNPNGAQIPGATGNYGVTAGRVAGGGNTQSVDQIGGVNSAFFRNMMGQLSPAFDQRRAEALAAAREGAGNLTGSGFANTLGSSINRSLGEERATLADYASKGIETEVQRAIADADRRSREGIAQAGYDTTASTSSMDNLLRAAGINTDAAARMADINQRAGQGNLDVISRILQGNQTAGIERGRLTQGASEANTRADTDFQNLLAKIKMTNQDVASREGMTQAQLDAERNAKIYGTEADTANQNAQRFLQLLLGMGTTGVGPGQVQTTTSGGIGSILGPIGGVLGSLVGGPFGGALGKKVFGG